MLRQALAVAAIASAAACGGGSSPATAVGDGETVTIYRDGYGTPHVFAASNRGVYFGYGYAVATDRAFQLEMLKRTVNGRVAEVLGAEFTALDRRLRTHYDLRAVRAQVDALAPADHDILTAYADGFNAGVAALAEGGGLPGAFAEYGVEPEPWTAADVAMLFVGSIAHRYSDFNSERDNLRLLRHLEARHGAATAWRIFGASKWLRDADSPTTVPRDDGEAATGADPRPAYLDGLPAAPPVARLTFDDGGRFAGLTNEPARAAAQARRFAAAGFDWHPEFAPASNYWAMTKLADASGALLNGPQFGFSMPSYVYGIGLHGGDFDTVGNTLLALPCLLFAHNDYIAWGSTAGLSDQVDEFVLRLNPENAEQYWHDGAWRDFERWQESIRVRGDAEQQVVARRAVHGMVVAHEPGSGTAWARARAWEGRELETLMAWIRLATDRSLDAADERIGRIATNINMYTMDREGRLGYVHAGRYPRRAPGHDPRLPAPGDGSRDWQGLRPYSDNPRVRDPAQGYVANWNNRPAPDWISSDLWPTTWGRAHRVQLLMDELEALRGGTVADLADINRRSSYGDVNASFLLPYLFAAFDGASPPPAVAAALATLRGWDRRWTLVDDGAFGPAPALMEGWLRLWLEAALGDEVGDAFYHLYGATNYPSGPLGAAMAVAPGVKALVRNLDGHASGAGPDYDFFNGVDPNTVLRDTFTRAVAELRAGQGEDPAAWRIAAHPMSWRPVNFRGVPQGSAANTVSVLPYMNRGSENNVFVATGNGIEGRDVVPPGQGGHLGAGGEPLPHHRDQLSLYENFGYKPLPFTEEAVREAAVSTEVLQLPARD